MKNGLRSVVIGKLADMSSMGIQEFSLDSLLHELLPIDPEVTSQEIGEILGHGEDGLKLSSHEDGGVKMFTMPSLVPLPGRQTHPLALRNWPSRKLRDQILMQIRTDFGGKNPIDIILREDGLKELTNGQAEAVLRLCRRQVAGSRARISDKVEELWSRAATLEKVKDTTGVPSKVANKIDNSPDPSVFRLDIHPNDSGTIHDNPELKDAIEAMLGRDPILGDRWYNGAIGKWLAFTGEDWI